MSIEMVDRSGMMRRSDEFAEARKVVVKRMITGDITKDPELYVQFTTIIQALEIAEAIARRQETAGDQ